MIATMLGPSLVDFRYILSTSLSQVTLVSTITALGYCLGTLVGGFAFQYFNRQLFVIISMSITALICAFCPFSPSLIIFLSLGLVFSFGTGTLDVAQNTWIIEMWQQHSNSVLQLAQFMFGLGMIVLPIVEGPYLTGEIAGQNLTNQNITVNNMSVHYNVTGEERRILLSKPFAVVGGVQLSAMLLMFLMYCYKKYERPPIVQDNKNDTKLLESSKRMHYLIITLISLCLGFYSSAEVCHFAYLVTYAQYKMKMTSLDGAHLQSALSASYTMMRAAGALIALKLSPGQMIAIHLSVVISSNIVLLFCSNSLLIFWTTNIVLGAGFSTMWGSIFSFAEKYLVFGNLEGTMLTASSGGLSSVSTYFIGSFIELHPEMLIYFNLLNSLISLTLFLFINLIILIWSRRYKINKLKV